ncbi:AAA family ATPase [Paenibacillus naphthalenovorans]|uniref:ATPase AAA n=1 Tax=Paenibacillus naphthalenovorans TaxID=162209 RepID=A0A0U2INU2_9BACL|nr:AAA family ATPase [Paenibacillus naphthalenovorans]ALS25307.1 ATPase AAA [Paenibacillus naphthalenovorans]
MVFREQHAYLRSIELLRDRIPSFTAYPFNLPSLRELTSLPLHPKVTYIIGENGMGKSTLLEAAAIAWGFNPEGGSLHFTFSTRSSHSELHRYIRLVRGVRKPKDGFFFRAETYYNLATNIDEMDREQSSAPPIIRSYGDKSLHEQSHGESFFAAFLHRFGGNGLYILDEPEAALSPFKQLSMLARIHALVNRNSQFIISTHSPILMGYPDALMYNLTDKGIEQITLEETDHYIIMKQFLLNRERMLKELFADVE